MLLNVQELGDGGEGEADVYHNGIWVSGKRREEKKKWTQRDKDKT